MRIKIQFSGRRYHLGDDLPDALDLPESATVADAVDALSSAVAETGQLPVTCLVVVDGRHLGTVADRIAEPLHDGAELLLLAPVAGGN